MKRFSLRSRLMIGFLVLTIICWGGASVGVWLQTKHKINQLFDTQQVLFAKRLLTLHAHEVRGSADPLPKTKKLIHDRGHYKDDALAFAIFTSDGQMLLNDGDKGKYFTFNDAQDGFVNSRLHDDDDPWRILWITAPDKRSVVAVGQEWEYRDKTVNALLKTNLIPWIIALPFMLFLLLWLIHLELSPLRKMTKQLRQRSPEDASPLETSSLPSEIRPIANALNDLFLRVNSTLLRERRFTADAAHELRSPLAALKVQSEVVQLAHNDTEMRHKALANLNASIDRTSRLIDQLLVFSRLEANRDLAKAEPVKILPIVEQVLKDFEGEAKQAEVSLILKMETKKELIVVGYPLLLSILFRNLIDNAIRYNHKDGSVTVLISTQKISVSDNGQGVSENELSRIGERFYRPPGQKKSGSGLGLSIVQNIATLHGLKFQIANLKEGGFTVTLKVVK